MFRIIIFFALWGLLPLTPHAAQPDSTAAATELPVLYDSTDVAARQFDAGDIAYYRAHPDFQYDEQAQALSWWQLLKMWWNQFWRDMLRAGTSNKAFDYLLIVLGVIALTYLVIKLIGMDNIGIFGRRASKTPLSHTEIDENIHQLDFEKELQQAVEHRNYRGAIRLLYLRCLKTLADKGLIDWKPAKTNADYLRELQDGPHSPGFKTLTYQYEYSWYGDFPVDQAHFHAVQVDFEQFDKEVRA